jgi:hypothetical protein
MACSKHNNINWIQVYELYNIIDGGYSCKIKGVFIETGKD